MKTHTVEEPTCEQLLKEALIKARNRKWEGWNWKDYQKAIVLQNWHLSEIEARANRHLSPRD